MAYPQEVKDYAKQLYLTPNPIGGHKYTLQKIAEKIEEQFPELGRFPNRSTIAQWTKARSPTGRSWRDIWEEGLVRGIKSAEKDYDRVLNKEEKVLEELQKFQRLQALISVDLRNRAYSFYTETDWKPENQQEANATYRLGLDIERSMKEELGSMDKLVEVIIRDATPRDVDDESLLL